MGNPARLQGDLERKQVGEKGRWGGNVGPRCSLADHVYQYVCL